MQLSHLQVLLLSKSRSLGFIGFKCTKALRHIVAEKPSGIKLSTLISDEKEMVDNGCYWLWDGGMANW